MNADRELAYEKCCRPVLYYYQPSEAPGLRPGTEKLVATTIAYEADAEGVLPEWDMNYLAEMSRMSVRTFRKYSDVLFDREWLIEDVHDGQIRVRIDPTWLKGLPPVPTDPNQFPTALRKLRSKR